MTWMLRTWILRMLLFAAAATLLGPAALAGEAPSRGQRNIVLYVVDDLGFEIGAYGDPVAVTPHLDRLAAEGTRFSYAYCTSSSCSASRSVILSGQYNHLNRQYGHEHSYHHFRTADDVQTLPVVLAEAGYRTCSIGKFHVGPREVYAFETYANQGVQGNRNSVRMAENAREFIERDDPRPFFLYICTSDPHRSARPGEFGNQVEYPGIEPVVFDPDAIPVPPWLPDQPEVRAELAEYYQAVNRIDQGLGRLWEVLDQTGHSDDTLVLFTSDNGPAFPGAKTTLYEPGVRMPLIVRSPDQQRRGVVTEAMITFADLMPTILDFAGVQPPPDHALHGRSFLPVLDVEEPEGWDEVYLSHTFHEITMYYPMRAIRRGQYKYILNLAHQLPYPFASDLYASPTWQGALERGDTHFGQRTVEAYLHRPRHELYDLAADPDEVVNLADDPGHSEVLAELQARLKAWQEETGDPWIVKYEYE